MRAQRAATRPSALRRTPPALIEKLQDVQFGGISGAAPQTLRRTCTLNTLAPDGISA